MNNENEKSFEELYEESLKETKLEKTVTGKIIAITKNGEIFVDIGYKADGIIPKQEYSSDENVDPKDELKVGDEITAYVLKQNDGLGNVLLSYKRVKQREAQKKLEEKIKNNEIFEEIVKEVNDKGIIVETFDKRVFIPLSLSGIPRGEDVSKLKGQTIKFRITEYDSKTNKLIGSVRIVIEEDRKKKQDTFWKNAQIGNKYKGIVASISSYGAFIELEGIVQGLLHISEISWDRNANVADILKQGEEIEVVAIDVDKENRRLKLSYKDKGPNPWVNIDNKYNINDVVKVKVVKIMPFGVFVELEPGIEGLVHISQIAERKLAKPDEELKINQHINAKIIELDKEAQRIELSIKELEGTSQEYKEQM